MYRANFQFLYNAYIYMTFIIYFLIILSFNSLWESYF